MPEGPHVIRLAVVRVEHDREQQRRPDEREHEERGGVEQRREDGVRALQRLEVDVARREADLRVKTAAYALEGQRAGDDKVIAAKISGARLRCHTRLGTVYELPRSSVSSSDSGRVDELSLVLRRGGGTQARHRHARSESGGAPST
jgi:hypothetical protein